MKCYVERQFGNRITNTNLQDVGSYASVPVDELSPEDRVLLDAQGCYIDEDDDVVTIHARDMHDYSDGAVNAAWWTYYDDELPEYLTRAIKDYPAYLVIAYGSNWRGQDGYTIADSIGDAVHRGYECTQRIIGGSAHGKVLALRESSHDVPCGSTTLIIGMTHAELDRVANMEYDAVMRWGERSFITIN